MANTRTTMGEQACLDALVADELTYFEDDGVTKVGKFGLYRKKSLVGVKLPNCKSIDNYAFGEDTNLEVVDMLGGGTISADAFSATTKLAHVIFRNTTTKTSTTTFQAAMSNKIWLGEGAIYVHPDLVSAYKSDRYYVPFFVYSLSEYPKTGLPETISDSWDDIITAVGNGTYQSKYEVGDVKSIEIDGNTYYMRLVAKDADVLASNGTTTVATSWLMFKRAYRSSHQMNSSSGTTGGWRDCGMRSWLNTTLIELLPSNVKSAIKEVRKYSDSWEDGAKVKNVQTSDKLWVPSARELWGGNHEVSNYGYETDGIDYQNTHVSLAKFGLFDPNGSSMTYSTRSVYDATQYYGLSTTANGFSYLSATQSNRFCFGFCI